MTFLDWASGKKTYLTVAAGVVLGVAEAFGYTIPGWLNLILTMLGLGFLRSGMSKGLTAQTQYATDAVEAVVKTVLEQTTVPVSSVAVGQVVVVPNKASIVVGKPSPKTISETEVTEALNAAQLRQ